MTNGLRCLLCQIFKQDLHIRVEYILLMGVLLALYSITVVASISLHVIGLGLRLTHEL